ncbi:hypothetical protein A0J48_005105 [Sphaerospermopsis aphanizomenoides BCCUSP55]|uniref:hypothetical protein n=1 Tax=Sphaerospermopsis aphanizomenoides TaxID=459663 RepID=UPI0019090254|nr:hypothetical protein [Sphaerospermopsis aphanizomenoides]MBK1986927.1 hypothetical protein [Sphaerospermopsis aphanizomenoides BCCUSP55]
MSLTDNQWEIAHAIAQTLVQQDTDVNEVGKTVAYLRTIIDKSDATSRFLTYLKTLVRDGKQIGHSGKTFGYYHNIEITCSQYFKPNSDAQTILQILGWVSRLMRYYKEAGVPIGEITTPAAPVVESARQAEIAKVTESQEFKEGDVIEAKVTKISGNKVSYEILEVIKLTEKEPKKASLLQEGQIVKVKIAALKEDGSIKSVKCIE